MQLEIRNTVRNLDITILIGMLFVFGIFKMSNAQEFHFSQLESNPQYLNPALIGFYSADYRAVFNYKLQNQFPANATSAQFRTVSFAYDMHFRKSRRRKSYYGAGLAFFNDKSGRAGLSVTNVDLTLAYHYSITEDYYLSFGFQAGMIQRNIDVSQLTTGSQFINGNFNSSLPLNENNLTPKASQGDMSLGGAWHGKLGRKAVLEVGAAAYHVNNPKLSAIGTNTGIGRKGLVYTAGEFGVAQKVEIHPALMYTFQNKFGEADVALFMKHLLERETYFWYGVIMENLNELVVETRFDYKNVHLGLSYDINLSLRGMPGNFGSPEVSIIYLGSFSGAPVHRSTFLSGDWAMPDHMAHPKHDRSAPKYKKIRF